MLKQLVEAILPGTSRLEAQLTEAEGDLHTKRRALNNLIIESGADDRAVTKLEGDVAAAERRAESLRSALQAAQQKHSVQLADAEREGKRAAWQRAVQLAEQRHAAVQKLMASMSQFAADYRAVLQANEDLCAALPTNPDRDANLTDRLVLETSLRKELVRLGVRFALAWPYGAATIEPLLPRLEGALEVVRRAVPVDLR